VVQVCILSLILGVGYLLKKYKFYYLPESAAAMLVRASVAVTLRRAVVF